MRAYIVMAYIVMAYTDMAYIVMAYIVMADLTQTRGHLVTASSIGDTDTRNGAHPAKNKK